MGLDKYTVGRLHQMRSARATSRLTPPRTMTPQPPAPAAQRPPRPSSMPSSTVQPRSKPGPATFRGYRTWSPTLPPSPRPASCCLLHASLTQQSPPSLWAYSTARLLPLNLFLPSHLMWFPSVTLCRHRKARFRFCYLYFFFPVMKGGFPLPYWV